jgi:uncharacterized cupin superfamily protein
MAPTPKHPEPKDLLVRADRAAAQEESFVHHVHLVDEEWMFVVSGEGELRIGDQRFTVGPGDFAGFPPRTHAHHLRNTGAGDLVYLSGGEAVDFGIAEFPDLGLRMMHAGKEAKFYPVEAGRDLFGSDGGAKSGRGGSR